ncbi:MAG: CotH kinase family protein [Salinivirgaceae bacterium]|jgi:spore coat protein CotH|nr:CotH kinase family protein [Salinivirgaceae bacterium]
MNITQVTRNPFILSILFLLINSGCEKDIEKYPEIIPPETSFDLSFLKEHNPGLASDIILTASGKKLKGRFPYTADIKNLVATFNETNGIVTVNNKIQESGITANDFSQILTYKLESHDGIVELYSVDATWFTGLPMVYIYTDSEVEIDSKEEYIPGNVTIVGGREFKDNAGEMEIRGRGHSTWHFHEKKPYQLKFNSKTEMLGMAASKRWVFLSEHSDKTLMRNRLGFEMGYMSKLDWTPESVYAEVFVNDDFKGVYNITPKVEGGDHRVDIGGSGYLLEIDTPDHLSDDDLFFESNEFTIQIKEPDTEFESAEYNYIKDYIGAFENALFGNNFTDPDIGYSKYIDVESFIDWYLINEIAKNVDARSYSSIYLSLVTGQKLKMGPLWDFDLGFGNVNYSDAEFPEGFWIKDNAWISRLFQDPKFVSEVKERFVYFKQNETYLLDIIDSTATTLKWAQYENDKRWEVFGNWIWPNAVVYETHLEEVNYLEDWLSSRMAWLDEAYKGL